MYWDWTIVQRHSEFNSHVVTKENQRSVYKRLFHMTFGFARSSLAFTGPRINKCFGGVAVIEDYISVTGRFDLGK